MAAGLVQSCCFDASDIMTCLSLFAGYSLLHVTITIPGHINHRAGNRKVIPSRAPKPWGPLSGELAQ